LQESAMLNPMATKKDRAAGRRLAATLDTLKAEKDERDRRVSDLRGALVRREAALATRAEVEAAGERVDPDAAVVARIEAERQRGGDG
jgi:putative heme iron utilization protein